MRRSRLLAVALSLLHLAAATIVGLVDVHWLAAGALFAALVASLWHSLRRHALLRSGSSVLALELRAGHAGAIRLRDGIWREVSVLPSSYISPRFSVLNLRTPGTGEKYHVILTADNVDPGDFRRLRVLLRWAPAKVAG